jgi:hypothetical protein
LFSFGKHKLKIGGENVRTAKRRDKGITRTLRPNPEVSLTLRTRKMRSKNWN